MTTFNFLKILNSPFKRPGLANDQRCVDAIKVAREFANGLDTKEELDAADYAAVADAYYAASSSAAYYAANANAAAYYAANASAFAGAIHADAAYYAAASAAANAATSDAMKKTQTIIFKKYMI